MNADGTAEGQLLPGTVSFVSARTHAAPAFGNPAHWAADLPETGRTGRHSPDRINVATEEAFHLRFLAQCAVPDTQMTTIGEVVRLVDVVTGAAASLTSVDGWWEAREGGPVRLCERIERVLAAYDEAGRPGPETFTLHVHHGGQYVRHLRLSDLQLPSLRQAPQGSGTPLLVPVTNFDRQTPSSTIWAKTRRSPHDDRAALPNARQL